MSATPGLRFDGAASTVTVRAPHADRVQVCRPGPATEARWDLDRSPYDPGLWVAEGLPMRPGDHYGFRVHGPGRDPGWFLLDPWALEVRGRIDWAGARFTGTEVDTVAHVPHAVVPPEGEAEAVAGLGPRTPWGRTVVYEANVRTLTAAHPDVPAEQRGTFAGLAHPAVVDHLVGLGVTAVELLPVATAARSRLLWARGLPNLWGYDPIAPLAPDARFAAGVDPAAELRRSVRVLHDAGLEVWLDVVFNHTGEHGRHGPVLSFKGLDPDAYRRHPDGRLDDLTGTGNTLDVRHPAVAELVLGTLRRWVTAFGIDGFRFDLATTLARDAEDEDGVPFPSVSPLLRAIGSDPVLGGAGVKLVAEPWDLGHAGYQVGHFPEPWREWDDGFRVTVRDAWRERLHADRLADVLAGHVARFGEERAGGVAYVTSHDGMTLTDLVTYDRKRNRANGEGDRDGPGDDQSWGSGVDGPTDDPAVLADRGARARSMLACLLLGRATPMLLGGDEVGRTQRGSSNGWCRDDDSTWVHWAAPDPDRRGLVRRLLAARRAVPEGADGQPALRWTLVPAEGEAVPARSGAVGDDPNVDATARPVSLVAGALWLAVNPTTGEVRLPAPRADGGEAWHPLVDTARFDGEPAGRDAAGAGQLIVLAPRSVVLSQAR